jgi:hypothetical protein
MDPVQAEWVLRQLLRVSNSTSLTTETVITEIGDSDQIRRDLDAHVQNQTNPHATTHLLLPDKGVNDHAAIDAHIQSQANPHATTHLLLPDKGVNDHAAIDAHIQDLTDPHETLVPWQVADVTFDLYPNTDPGNAGIGTLEKPVSHVAIGTQEGTGVSGIEGLLLDNDDLQGGGIMLFGVRDVDPANPPDPVIENSPVFVIGNPVALGNQVMVELSQAITEDHEVVFGPTITLSGGRHFAPLVLGPKKVYSQSEEATDAADHNVLDLGDVEIVSLTLVNSYVVGATFTFSVFLENLGGKATEFDVLLKLDGVTQGTYERSFTGSGGVVTDSFPITATVNAGQVISLDVNAISTAPQSQGWVMGTTQESLLRVQQG